MIGDDQSLSLPSLRTRLLDLEHKQVGGDLRPALGESVQARSENDVLADAIAGLFHDQVLDEASTGHDGCSKVARGMWVHVRTATPAFVGGRQPQANLIFEHMRRRIDLDMHGPPQGDPHRCAVWRRHLLIMHDVFSPFRSTRTHPRSPYASAKCVCCMLRGS